MSDPTVRDFMSASPHTIGLGQTLRAASELMRSHSIRHLPVLEGGALEGILSTRDVALVEALGDVDAAAVTVEEAMSASPYHVGPDAPLKDVVTEMIEHKYGAVVVMEGPTVAGILTTIDALRALRERL